MKTNLIWNLIAGTGLLIALTRLTQYGYGKVTAASAAAAPGAPAVAVSAGAAEGDARRRAEHGRYLVRTAGCNDCHTPGFMQQGEKVPESEWLTGVPLGWRGPWGTSYASNLRLHVAAFPDAATWIAMVRSRNGLPPMPWPSLHAMTDADLGDVFAYIRSLEPKGAAMPTTVPPGEMPVTPYLNMEPVMPLAR